MNATLERTITVDSRIANCRHPRLREALMFHPNGRPQKVEAPQKAPVVPVPVASQAPDIETVNPVAKAMVRVVEIGVAGLMLLCSPL